jgi:hypothetical protein
MGSGEKLYSCGTRYSTCYRTHAHVSRSHRGSLQQCLKSFAGSSTITGFACLIYIKSPHLHGTLLLHKFNVIIGSWPRMALPVICLHLMGSHGCNSGQAAR